MSLNDRVGLWLQPRIVILKIFMLGFVFLEIFIALCYFKPNDA